VLVVKIVSCLISTSCLDFEQKRVKIIRLGKKCESTEDIKNIHVHTSLRGIERTAPKSGR
jgi:hypothetical protein